MAIAANYSVEPSAISGAVDWIAGALTGTVSTVIATLAIAGLGFQMLQGRMSARDGFRVAIGCFVLFGASAISRELLGLARRNSGPAVIEVQAPPAPLTLPSPPSPNRDPYAGASVPQ